VIDIIRNLLGALLLVGFAIGPLALSKRARTDYRRTVWISAGTFLALIPLIYVGTFLQPPPEAIDHPVRTLLTGLLFCLSVVVIGNLLWRTLVMARSKNHG
jgi:hypothetical protein